VAAIDNYTVKLGDTMWKIAKRHNVPYWFLSRTNQGVDSPSVGQRVRVPVLEARNESKQPLVESN